MAKSKSTSKKAGRPSKAIELLPQLKAVGIFSLKDAKRLGISQPTLSRLVAAGKIIRQGHGLYSHPESHHSPESLDFAVACAHFGPDAIIAGMTALFHYQLLEQVPTRIWVIVPYEVKSSNPLYRCIRTKTDPSIGVLNRGQYRITNLERTLVEALRYSSKIGLRTALRAIRTAVKEKRTTLAKVLQQAKALGLEKFVVKHWESLIPESEAA